MMCNIALNIILTADCNGTHYEKSGIIQSPGYPVLYDNNLLCQYVIRQPAGSNMTILFEHFELEDEPNCSYDYLKV